MRLDDLFAEKADVVVAPVIVEGDEQGGGKCRAEAGGGQGLPSGRKRDVAMEVGKPDEDDESQGGEHAGPEVFRDASHGRDAAVDKEGGEGGGEHGQQSCAGDFDGQGDGAEQREGEVGAPEDRAQGGRDVGGIAGQADASGGDGDRGAEDELEDEEE